MARTREFDTDAAIEAAMSAFRRKGYEGTSIQDLVEATGVGRGSLYAAFTNKDGLYLAAMDRYRERYSQPLVELLGQELSARELIREVFVGLVDEILDSGSSQACLVVSAAMERAQHDPAVARRLRSSTGSIEDAFFELLLRERVSGRLAEHLRPRDLARFLVMALQGVRVMGAINPDRPALMASVEVTLSVLG